MDFSLTNLINESIADSKEDKVYDSWRASQLGGCPRKAFYQRLGIEPTSPPDERTERVFEVGNVFHKWIQDVARQSGEIDDDYASPTASVIAEREILDSGLDLAGRYDLLLKTGGKRILFDIKTINSRAFWHLENSGKTVKEKFPQYWKQLGAYMLMLKRQGNPVDEGRILLVSKDDLTLKEVTYLLTLELKDSVLSEVGMLNEHWKAKTLPPCICPTLYVDKNGRSSGAKYCSYRDPENPSTCCSEKLWQG